MNGLRVGFILCSRPGQPLPSTRIAVLNLLPLLAARGIATSIVYAPEAPAETPPLAQLDAAAIARACDVVVFQKVRGTGAVALAGALRAAGVATMFAVCDRIDVDMARATDATIVVTDYLKSMYEPALQPKVHVVHDGIENLDAHKQQWHPGHGTRVRPLRALLVTSASLDHLPAMPAPPSWLQLRIVGNYPPLLRRLPALRKQWSQQNRAERLRYLAFLLNRRIACVQWGADSVYTELAAADIGVLPITPGASRWGDEHAQVWQRKSENRLTLKMAMGLPVIATPIPAYESVIRDGENGFLARTPADWTRALAALREPGLRRAMGAAARASVLEAYSQQRQAQRFCAVLDLLAAARTGNR